MNLIIVSGVSGSGKSTVLHVLEDLGYYCIDNLPVGMLSAFATQMECVSDNIYEYAAIGIDARNRISELGRFSEILAELRAAKLACQVLFLDADDNILLKRFSETRRKHPLTSDVVPLKEAITEERALLDSIASNADLYIDTSRTNLHQLRDLIRDRVAKKNTQTLSLLFQSFGFKHGIPIDADLVFDARCLPNPYWKTQLRKHTGLDKPVIDFLQAQPMVEQMFDDITSFLTTWIPRFQAADRSYLTIAIGCTGGQHRSVFLVERLEVHFKDVDTEVIARHRELQ